MHTSMNERASPQQSTSPTNSYESACRLSTGRLSQQHRERTHAQAPTAASAVLHTLMPCQRQNVTAPRPTAQSYAERLTQNAHPALKQEPPYATARRSSSPGQQDVAHVPLLARAGSVQSPGSQLANPRGGAQLPPFAQPFRGRPGSVRVQDSFLECSNDAILLGFALSGVGEHW